MKKWGKITVCGLGVFVMSGLVVGLDHNAKPPETGYRQDPQQAPLPEAASPNAKRDLVITTFSWQKDEAGVKAYHWFSIHNQSKQHAYGAIPVRFTYYSELGDEVGRLDQVIDKAIGPDETVHLDKVATALGYDHADGADLEIIE